MLIVWLILGGLGALVFTIVIVGLFMPERYEGRSQVSYEKSPVEVWNALQDYDKHPMTGRMKKSVQPQVVEDENLPAWIEEMGHGERITVTTVESLPPRRLVREMVSQAVPMTSRWTYSLEPLGDDCQLTMEAETFIRKGTWHVPIFRVMMVLGGGVKKGLDIQMDMVAKTLDVPAKRDN